MGSRTRLWRGARGLVHARDEGLTRFIGVTGHGLRIARMHLRSLERFDYDSVLLPYNFTLLADAGYRSDVEELLGVCEERSVAVQTIKSIARRRWQEASPAADHERRSWYEPLVEAEPIGRAVRYVLARPSLFLASSSEFQTLRSVLEAADSPAPPPSDGELRDTVAFAIAPFVRRR